MPQSAKWRLTKIDVKTAFFQTGQAARDVYVVPPKKCKDRHQVLWLLLTASYGLVSSNAKWQVIYDHVLHDIGFCSIAVLPHLFYLKEKDGSVIAALSKIVDDFLICGETLTVNNVVDLLNKSFLLGIVVHGPGVLRYFGLNITQHDGYTTIIDGDDKLNRMGTAPVTRVRRSDVHDTLSPTERKMFASINSSVDWLCITASPLCFLISSIFQQNSPTATIATLCNQSAQLKQLQIIETHTYYCRPGDTLAQNISIIVFCDAIRSGDAGQLSHIGVLLIDEFACGSIFRIISCSSRKARFPVKSTGAAETIAAGEDIEIGKTNARVYFLLLPMKIDLIIVVDSKDLYTTLTTKRQSIGRSIRGDIGVIGFELEVRNVSKIIWIPGKLDPADARTKFDSPLTSVVAEMLSSGKILFTPSQSESCLSNRWLG